LSVPCYLDSFEGGLAVESETAGVLLVAAAPFGAGCGGTGCLPCREFFGDESVGVVARVLDCSGWLETGGGVGKTVGDLAAEVEAASPAVEGNVGDVEAGLDCAPKEDGFGIGPAGSKETAEVAEKGIGSASAGKIAEFTTKGSSCNFT